MPIKMFSRDFQCSDSTISAQRSNYIFFVYERNLYKQKIYVAIHANRNYLLLHRKNSFVEVSKNLARYRFENNFVVRIIM